MSDISQELIARRIVPDLVAAGRVTTVREEAPISDAVRLLLGAEDVAALAVVDTAGTMRGILTCRDILARVAEDGGLPNGNVGSCAQREIDHLAPGDSPLDAAELMLLRGVSHLPVVDQGRPVAILAARTLLTLLHQAAGEGVRRRHTALFAPCEP